MVGVSREYYKRLTYFSENKMRIREIQQKILDASLGICLNKKLSILNIIKQRMAKNMDTETNAKLLQQAKDIEKAMQIIKNIVYDSC